MRLVTISALALTLFTSSAQAQVNLSWSDCGTAGTEHRFFGCETNTGPAYTLYGSFAWPYEADEIEFLGLNARIEMVASSETTPDWWKTNTGQCRANALSMSVDFTGSPYTCADVWLGFGAGGMVVDEIASNRNRLRLSAAIPYDNRTVLETDVEYYAFRINVQRHHTVAPDACAGCDAAYCFFLEEIQLFQDPMHANDPILMYPIHRSHAVWQNGYAGWGHHGPSYCVDGPPTAANAGTWGTVKSLYR